MILDSLIGPNRPIAWVFRFWPVLAASFVGSLGATWLCKKIALKFGIVDRPDNLVKIHKEPIAYLGGVGMLIGLTVGMLAGIGCLRNELLFGPMLAWLLAVLAGGAIACFVGLTDDIFDMKPAQKILGQVIPAVILLLVGIRPTLHYITGFLNLPMPHDLEVILGIFLCAGVTAIITVAMLLLTIHLATWGFSELGDPVRIVICLGLVGCVCGFLPFNRHPAKIFMGDAGSMLLGFTIAALMILFAEQIPRWWIASIVVFGLPILDTAVALVRRLLNHRPLFVSDRGHIYDQMIDRGIPLKKTVAICYVLAAMYALIGLAMSQIKTRYAAIVHILVFVVSGFVIWKKGYLRMEGLRGAIPKQD
jgi:UDP-GlcNAc:undecaprenyl-phosphate GlcNAc-1-phosphate transferase